MTTLPLAFDIGARHGTKTDLLLSQNHRVVAVEPLPAALKILQSKYAQDPRVEIVPAAVSDHNGHGDLCISQQDHLFCTLDPLLQNSGRFKDAGYTFPYHMHIPTLTLHTLINRYGVPHYLKLDIEGHERTAFTALRTPIPYIRFEFHIEHYSEVEACLAHLGSLGRLLLNYSTAENWSPALFSWLSRPADLRERLKDAVFDFRGQLWGDIHVITFPFHPSPLPPH